LGFSKEEIGVSITHHISHAALENDNYTGANASRPTWETSYGKDYVDSILQEELNWTTTKDIKIFEKISLCDIVEALRNDEREYQDRHDWDIDYENNPSVTTILNKSLTEYKINEECLLTSKMEYFRDQVDFYIECGSGQRMRELVAEKCKAKDLNNKVAFSETKVVEILEKPELGIIFVEEDEFGKASIDLGNGKILDIGKKEILDFENVQARNLISFS